MAKGILAGEPLTCNDLNTIAEIIEQSFDYYKYHNPPLFLEFLQSLRTLVGLGFTAALANSSLLYFYQSYLERFLVMEEQAFEDNRGLGKAVAQMIRIASICFYMLKFPRYYQDFIAHLGNILNIPEESEQKETKRILDRLVVS